MSHGYRIAPSIWLATGAVTVGVGAALALGTGVAEADTGASGNTSTGARAHHETRSPGPATKAAKSVGGAAAKAQRPKVQTLKSLTPQTSSRPAPRVSAAAPRAFQWPTPQMVIQQAINVVVPLMNNTPIRNMLDIIDPPAPGTSVVRLLGRPVSTTLSPDGTRAYVTTTDTFGSIPILGSLVGSVSTVNVIDTATNTISGCPWSFGGGRSVSW